MLRLGVCRPEQFFEAPPKGLLRYLYYRLSRGRVSLHLLAHAGDHDFECLMRHVQLPNGVYRTTFRNRFRNLDPLVNEILLPNFSMNQELIVEDWAASACLTSCEWAATLLPRFPHLRFTASDLVLFLVEVEDKSSGAIFIASHDGQLLQYIRSPYVVRITPPESWQAPVNRLLFNSAVRRWRELGGIWPLPEAWLDFRCEDELEREGCLIRKLPLIHPQALWLARREPRFSVRSQSIFETAPTQCHVIRSMNILNRAYFSEKQLAQATRSIVESLLPGGIWILGRTISDELSTHDVSILRKHASGDLEILHRVGAGAEVESIALDMALAAR